MSLKKLLLPLSSAIYDVGTTALPGGDPMHLSQSKSCLHTPPQPECMLAQLLPQIRRQVLHKQHLQQRSEG